MKVIRGKINQILNNVPLCLTIGNFDGVHKGHQTLLKATLENDATSAALTFDPHPTVFLRNLSDYRLVTPIEQKSKVIESLGIGMLFIVEFDQDAATMTKEAFITFLQRINVKTLVCGQDFAFGRYAEGHVQDLLPHFQVNIIPDKRDDGARISTTAVKAALASGQISETNRLLGRHYSMMGNVVSGRRLGRTIGYPTVNLDVFDYVIPKQGVYAVDIYYKNDTYRGMCNIGHNPTFNHSEYKKIEVHILDFEGDLYGESIEMMFISYIRAEHKFNSKDELIEQLKVDEVKIREAKS